MAAKKNKRNVPATLDQAMGEPATGKLSSVPEREVVRLSEALRDDREERPRTIDDVVARHTPPEGPSPAHGHRAVPPEERPDRRDGATLGPVNVFDDPDIPDESDDRIRSLEDLMARFPLTGKEGDYFIRVVRVAPRTYHGMTCTGIQRRIVNPMTQEQFSMLYGGGEYELTVYGPPNGPGVYDPHTGKVMARARTRPIRFTVPYDRDGVFGLAPNPEASVPDADEAYPMENPMQPVTPTQPGTPQSIPLPRPMPGRISTTADASMLQHTLNHEVRLLEREDTREERERARQEAESRVDRELELERLRMQERREKSAAELAHEQAVAEREQRLEAERALRERDSKTVVPPVDIPALIQAVKGDGADLRMELSRLAELHKTELLRLTDTHRTDLERTNEANRREIDRERSLCEEKIRLMRDETTRERERLDQRLKDAEERAAARVREAEDRTDRRVAEVRSEYERQLTAQERFWESRLKDEQRNSDREVNSRKESHDLSLRTEKTTFEVQLKAHEAELSRLRSENERLRTELAASGDVVSQVEKVTKVATALGFQKASDVPAEEAEGDKPPSDWRSLLATLGEGVIKNLPEIMRSAGDTVSALRNRQGASTSAAQPAGEPMAMPPAAAPRGQFRPRQRVTFAQEDEPFVVPAPGTEMIASPPIYDQGMDLGPPPPPPIAAPLPVPQSVVSMAYPEQPASPPPPPASRPPAPPPPAQEMPEQEAMVAQVLSFREGLESTFLAGTSVKEFVEGLVNAVGADTVRQHAQILSADRVIAVIEAQPDGAKSPLVSFKGKRWLRDFEAAARAV